VPAVLEEVPGWTLVVEFLPVVVPLLEMFLSLLGLALHHHPRYFPVLLRLTRLLERLYFHQKIAFPLVVLEQV
jgi:hypothetical protein